MHLEDRALRVVNRLQEKYPEVKSQLNWTDPWHLLVSTILSTQCTDKRVNQVTPVFFKNWPTIDSLSQADPEEVERVIHSTGLYRNKAKNLINTAKKLVAEFNATVPSNMQDLLALPGVARKTANIVLSQAFSLNAGIAVDTHVKRISYRLGFTRSKNPDKVEKDLQSIFPHAKWANLNLLFVSLGRDICTAQRPLCPDCMLTDICPKHIYHKQEIDKTKHS